MSPWKNIFVRGDFYSNGAFRRCVGSRWDSAKILCLLTFACYSDPNLIFMLCVVLKIMLLQAGTLPTNIVIDSLMNKTIGL
jgi:hypothetical protein